MVFWHRSIHYVGPGLATLLANFQVFLVAAAGVLFLKEKITKRLVLSIITALAGLYLIVAQDWSTTAGNYRAGVLMGLLAALSYTFYLFALRRTMVLPERLPLFANMAVMSLTSALFLYLAAVFTGESLVIPRPVDWLWLLIYGLFCHSLGWILIATGMPQIPASKTGLILLMQPALAFVWDILIFARPTTAVEALGAIITLGAIYLGAVRR
jgi:drug/metabolite transporter (DMT)-like permease